MKRGAVATGALVLGSALTSGTAVADIGDGRVLDYHMNNIGYDVDKGTKIASHVHDASPYKNHGVWNGADDPVVKGGAVGNAYTFDGGSYVSVSKDVSATFDTEVSMAAWVKPDIVDSWTTIAALNDYTNGENSPPALLRATNRGEWEFFLDTSYGNTYRKLGRVTGGSVQTGVWTHVAGTYDGSAVKVYVDGTEVARENFSGTLDAPVDGLLVGAWQLENDGGFLHYWDGCLDEVRVYNRALSAVDVQELVDMRDTA